MCESTSLTKISTLATATIMPETIVTMDIDAKARYILKNLSQSIVMIDLCSTILKSNKYDLPALAYAAKVKAMLDMLVAEEGDKIRVGAKEIEIEHALWSQIQIIKSELESEFGKKFSKDTIKHLLDTKEQGLHQRLVEKWEVLVKNLELEEIDYKHNFKKIRNNETCKNLSMKDCFKYFFGEEYGELVYDIYINKLIADIPQMYSSGLMNLELLNFLKCHISDVHLMSNRDARFVEMALELEELKYLKGKELVANYAGPESITKTHPKFFAPLGNVCGEIVFVIGDAGADKEICENLRNAGAVVIFIPFISDDREEFQKKGGGFSEESILEIFQILFTLKYEEQKKNIIRKILEISEVPEEIKGNNEAKSEYRQKKLEELQEYLQELKKLFSLRETYTEPKALTSSGSTAAIEGLKIEELEKKENSGKEEQTEETVEPPNKRRCCGSDKCASRS